MSFLERQQGQLDGSAATARSYGAAIAQWEQFADGLQAQLAKAESSRIGFAQLLRAVSAELQRVDPTNPLLDKDKQLAILQDHIAKKAAELGYSYDPVTDAIQPRR